MREDDSKNAHDRTHWRRWLVWTLPAVSVASAMLLATAFSGSPTAFGGSNTSAQPPDSHGMHPQPSLAARNAEPATVMPGVGRPCAEAGGFDEYSLGDSFAGLALTGNGRNRQCEPPPEKIPDPSGTLVFEKPGRINLVGYTYGRCKAVSESGCAPPLWVASSPACEQPLSLYRRYTGPVGGRPVPHIRTKFRGAPGIVFDQGSRLRIEIYTGDARVVIGGERPDVVRRAAAQIVAPPSSKGGARRPDQDLPQPVAGAADETASRNPSC